MISIARNRTLAANSRLILMAGEIASLLLSRMTVPVLFYLVNQGRRNLA